MSYQVFDTITKQPATNSTYSSRQAASKVAGKMDAKYGAVRYVVKMVG